MSKKVNASMECRRCGTEFPIELYRTLWLEYPENRELVFNDLVNRFSCPGCGSMIPADFSLMATHKSLHFAVWYEPQPDPHVDSDRAGYVQIFGEGNYFAEAPRIRDWEEFKRVIIEFESGQRVGKLPTKEDPTFLLGGLPPVKEKFWSRIFRKRSN